MPLEMLGQPRGGHSYWRDGDRILLLGDEGWRGEKFWLDPSRPTVLEDDGRIYVPIVPGDKLRTVEPLQALPLLTELGVRVYVKLAGATFLLVGIESEEAMTQHVAALAAFLKNMRLSRPYRVDEDGDFVHGNGEYVAGQDSSPAGDVARAYARRLLEAADANALGGCRLCRA